MVKEGPSKIIQLVKSDAASIVSLLHVFLVASLVPGCKQSVSSLPQFNRDTALEILLNCRKVISNDNISIDIINDLSQLKSTSRLEPWRPD